MFDYYEFKLAADRLRQCYAVAPSRTIQYLEAEASYVFSKIRRGQRVLELGCGYGRFLKRILTSEVQYCGIDLSKPSIALARRDLAREPSIALAVMNAATLAFSSSVFDLTLCIQNGISAFHVDPIRLFQEAVRVTRPRGMVLFSTYTTAFWPHRLEWFESQARAHLIGPIDYSATQDGTIVCKDGFHATTVDRQKFEALAASVGQEPEIVEIDDSSLFCQMIIQKP